jgi:nitroreductase
MDLESRLTELAGSSPGDRTWQPELLQLDRSEDRLRLETLLAENRVRCCCDTIDEQLRELEACLDPGCEDEAELARRAAERLGDRPSAHYGTWVYYPWSAALVHCLPAAEFRRVRLDRNRYKITPEEQSRLATKRVGVVGLSVGHGIATTLALEGIAGELRLTDMDVLGLSNLNRLRAGVAQLGVEKALLAAREVQAIDPYLRVRLFPRGLDAAGLDDFLLAGGRLDLVIEECDNLALKVRLRQRARELGIPVVMETADRGLIDVERFDREPDRPLFHGVAGPLEADGLEGLTTEQKVPIVFKLLGQGISDRAAGSLVEIGESVSSWPQLGSGVTLGAATVCDSARRILLEQMHGSGRFYVDLETLVADGAGVATEQCRALDIEAPQEALSAARINRVAGSGAPGAEQVRYLVEHALLAPSGGNNQPWRFIWRNDRLDCLADWERAESFLDLDYSATWLAFGAVAENLALAAGTLGRRAEITLQPEPERSDLLCRVRFAAGATDHPWPRLVDQVAARVTNRKLGQRTALEPEAAAAMRRAAESAGAELHLIEQGDALAAMGELLGEGDRLRFLSKPMHREMMAEMRWSREEAERTRDGLDIATLELSPADVAAMRVVSSWKAMKLVAGVGGGRALLKISRRAVAAAAAVGLVATTGRDPASFFRGGRAMQRVWLAATAHGLAFQPMTAITYVFPRLERAEPGLERRQVERLAELRRRYLELLPVDGECFEAMLFRVARADPPSARALRRRLDDVLQLED